MVFHEFVVAASTESEADPFDVRFFDPNVILIRDPAPDRHRGRTSRLKLTGHDSRARRLSHIVDLQAGTRAALVRDPDGHAILLERPKPK
jgi:hypothetical protein